MKRSDRILAITLMLLFLSIMPVAAYSYNRNAAAAYAYNNALKDVPNSAYFQALGGDCTNFASYCLQAGGWKQVIDLNAGINVYKSDQSWYSISTAAGRTSYSWGGAQPFYNFLVANYQRATPVSVVYSQDKLQKGDIIQSDTGKDGRFNGWDHTMVVSDKRNGIIYLSYHNSKVRDISFGDMKKKMESQANGQPVRYIGWHINDQYSY